MKTSTNTSKSNLATVLTRALAVAAMPFVVVACCRDVENPDEQLQVEVLAPAGEDIAEEQSLDEREKLCGAEVVAVAPGGEEIALEEVALESGCAYRGLVDANETYTIRTTHEDLQIESGGAVSNPGCSVATDPEDTDAQIELVEAPEALTAAAALRPNSARYGR